MQVVLAHLIVDATGRDTKKFGRLRLVAVRVLESGLNQQFFTVLQRLREVPSIEVKHIQYIGMDIKLRDHG